VLLAGADWGARVAGDTVFPGGPLDELAHLLTTVVVFWALGSRACRRFLVPAMIASVAIDLDHVPGRFGVDWLTAGTPRPYSHSVLVVAAVLGLAALWPRRRDLLLGVAIGLAIHFWRDMGEGGAGVSLLWPVSYRAYQYPHGAYVAVIALFVVIDAARCVFGGRAMSEPVGAAPVPTPRGGRLRVAAQPRLEPGYNATCEPIITVRSAGSLN